MIRTPDSAGVSRSVNLGSVTLQTKSFFFDWQVDFFLFTLDWCRLVECDPNGGDPNPGG